MSNSFTKGLILKISNIGVLGVVDGRKDESFKPESEDQKDQIVSRELLTQIFGAFGQVKHTEFRMGQDWCTVRYSERDTEASKKAIANFATNPLVLGQSEVKMEILEGDEEKKVWDVIINGRDGKKRERGDRSDRGYDRYDDRRRFDDRRRDDYYRRRDDDDDDYNRRRPRRDDDYYDDRRRDRRDEPRRYDDYYERRDRRDDERRDRRDDERRDRRDDERRENKEQDW